jgi:hypothetical protein
MLSRQAASAFAEFIRSHSSSFRRIASNADASVSAQDVQQDAWLIANEIAEKRGKPVDFSNLDDQATVISWLYTKFVKFTSRQLRNAIRIDREDDDEKSASITLSGSDNDNPLNQLLRSEDDRRKAVRVPPIVSESYSQASVYAMLLARSDGKWSVVAKLLGITRSAFVQRLRRAYAWIEVQPSLFDRIVCLDLDFMPPAIGVGMTLRQMAERAGAAQIMEQFELRLM